jgi:hypothetical protein
MRIIRSSSLPAVVLVRGPGVCAVAIPDGLPSAEILELASLVLSTTEYEEFRHAVRPPGEVVTPAGRDVGSPRLSPRRDTHTARGRPRA